MVISTSTKPHRVEETLRVFDFALTEEQIGAIDSAAQGQPPHKQFWQNTVLAKA